MSKNVGRWRNYTQKIRY